MFVPFAFRRALPLLFFVFAACNDSGTDPDRVPVEIRLSSGDTALASGSTVQLSATVLDRNGRPLSTWPRDLELVWSSSDTSVVNVRYGLLTAKRTGQAEVRAALGTIQAQLRVQVDAGEVAVVRITPDSLVLAPPDTTSLTARAFDAFGNEVPGTDFTWATSDTTVATVSSTGRVSARRSGQVTVSAVASSGRGTARVQVRPVDIHVRGFPQDTTVKSTRIELMAEVESPVPIARFYYSLNGLPTYQVPAGSHAPPLYRFPLSAEVAHGIHTLELSAYDQQGRVRATEWVRFRVSLLPARRYSVTYLGAAGGGDSRGVDLNERNQVVGWSATGGGDSTAFFWADGRLIDLGRRKGGAYFMPAIGINDAGEVVGTYQGDCQRVFRWRAGQQEEPNDFGECGYQAVDINNTGNVLLQSRQGIFLWRDGAATPVKGAHVFSSFYYYPTTLNNRDHVLAFFPGVTVVSSVLTVTDPPQVLYDSKGCRVTRLNDLGDFIVYCSYIGLSSGQYQIAGTKGSFPGRMGFVNPYAINNRRQIVGMYGRVEDERAREPFLWEGGAMYTIETTEPGWILDAVSDINDAGVILAHGRNSEMGRRGAVLLTPVQ